MINNQIKQANYKLSQHRQLGNKSNMSIFEVARLLDLVRQGENAPQMPAQNLFFSIGLN